MSQSTGRRKDTKDRFLIKTWPGTPTQLPQVFQLPYVQQHVQRYHKEEKRRAKKTANAMTQRRKERGEWDEDATAGPPKDMPVRRRRADCAAQRHFGYQGVKGESRCRRGVREARRKDREEWDEDATAGPPKDMPVRKGGGER